MRRTRQILAVMLVTTALCADRGAAALSVASPQTRTSKTQADGASLAGRFFARLSRTLGQQVMVVLPREPARVGRAVATGSVIRADQLPQPAHTPFSPFQFRLPPPIC